MSFVQLLRTNRNYRYAWTGQVVSEIGDHFNNIAVFSLALAHTKSGLVVSGVMLARAVPAMLAGPLAGVLLDRLNRRQVMLASDLVRAVVAAAFILTVYRPENWLLYLLSGMLMFASPFFTSGRTAILPAIASKAELHTANSLTQTTQWTTLIIGTFLAGASVAQFGFAWAFLINTLSFVISALCIWQIRLPEGAFTARRNTHVKGDRLRPWQDYKEGLRYIASTPLVLGIALVGVGWASGGGAAQILFSLFGEIVFERGPAGIGIIWGCAGIGLLIGGLFAHRIGTGISFANYKRLLFICYILHGAAYVVFSQMRRFWAALIFIALSRAAIAVSSVLNTSKLLRHVPDEFRGRVFATLESLIWSTMMVSMMFTGIASQTYNPRVIGAWAGVVSTTTALFWAWAHWTGRLKEPRRLDEQPEEVQVRETPAA